MYIAPLPYLSQGDILRSIDVHEPMLKPEVQTIDAIVLSHDCDIDKRDGGVCLVARIKPVDGERPDFQARIRTGRVANTLYLPATPGLEEGFVDFRYMYRVRYKHIGANAFDGAGRRILGSPDPRSHSLSDDGLTVLRGSLGSFFLRLDQPRRRE
jgi:hypothetical protein